MQCDVPALKDVGRLYNEIQGRKGKLDIVFANAGTSESAPLGQVTEEHFDKQFDVNVKLELYTVQQALPLQGASIVFSASIVSITENAALSVYRVTKAAVRSFARSWRVDLEDRQARVNATSQGIAASFHRLGMATLRIGLVVVLALGRRSEVCRP